MRPVYGLILFALGSLLTYLLLELFFSTTTVFNVMAAIVVGGLSEFLFYRRKS